MAVEAAEPDDEELPDVKYAVRSGPYQLCKKAGIGMDIYFQFRHLYLFLNIIS